MKYLPFLCGLFLLLACGKANNFEVPSTQLKADGWAYYEEAIPIHERNAKRFSSAGQGSPEAATTQFFASLISGNKNFETVIPTIMSDRLVKNLNFYEELDFSRMELVRKKEQAKQVAITVRMMASYEGDHEEGEDEVVLELQNEKWFLISLPR